MDGVYRLRRAPDQIRNNGRNLIIQDIEFQLERADWFQFFRGEMSMKLEKQYLHDNHIREKGLERFKSHITVPEAKINPVC